MALKKPEALNWLCASYMTSSLQKHTISKLVLLHSGEYAWYESVSPMYRCLFHFTNISGYTFIIHTFDSVTCREIHYLMWDNVKTVMRYSKLYKISRGDLHSWDLRFFCSSDFSVHYLFILTNKQCWSLKSVIQHTHSFFLHSVISTCG